MKLLLKPEVEEQNVSREIWFALGVYAAIKHLLFGNGVAVTVTAMRDGAHMVGSKHYEGEAADLRSVDLNQDEARRVALLAHEILDPMGFDSLFEKNHFHVEFDPKPGERFLERLPKMT